MKKKRNINLLDELLIKYLTGSSSMAERQEALSWIHESNMNKRYFDELKDIYDNALLAKLPEIIDAEKNWEIIKESYIKSKNSAPIQQNKKTQSLKILKYALPFAASVIIAFLLGNLLQVRDVAHFNFDEGAFSEVIVPRGSRTQIVLPDNSKVWLNSESRLKYSKDFAVRNREVFLEGEGFFDVSHDSVKQFIVNTSEVKVKVYGTRFNIKSYPNENFIETTLEEGAISIEQLDKKKKELILHPNETVTYYKKAATPKEKQIKQKKLDIKALKGKFQQIEQINPTEKIAWKDNKLIFKKKTMREVVNELGKWYNIEIKIADESINEIEITATFTTETVEQAIYAICIASDLTYEINKNNVTLKTK